LVAFLEKWNGGGMEWWRDGVMEWWSNGVMEMSLRGLSPCGVMMEGLSPHFLQIFIASFFDSPAYFTSGA
jgi:hypothetical protein